MVNGTASASRRDNWIDVGLLLAALVLLAAGLGLVYGVSQGKLVGGAGGEKTAVFTSQPPIFQTQTTAIARPQLLPLQPTDAPQQAILTRSHLPTVRTWGNDVWTLTPRATFAISARVLGVKRYSDWQADILPMDFALAWGALSDPRVDDYIEWSQSNRWYHYRWATDSPYQFEAIRDESTNVHIIPANEAVAAKLAQVQAEDVVYLAGHLVDVTLAKDGEATTWLLRTSLTREDTGGGACEILLVEVVMIGEPREG